MSKLTKNQKAVLAKYDKSNVYSLQDACALLKEITYTKFDASEGDYLYQVRRFRGNHHQPRC